MAYANSLTVVVKSIRLAITEIQNNYLCHSHKFYRVNKRTPTLNIAYNNKMH